MDLWGVQAKDGKRVKVKVDDNEALYISQAALGEIKNDKGNEFIPLFLHANDQKFVIGALCTGTIYNISYDLVLAKDFELSHNWKNGSIYFCGYKTFMPEDLDDNTTNSDSGDEFPVAMENGEPEPREEKPNLTSDAKSGKIAEPCKNDNSRKMKIQRMTLMKTMIPRILDLKKGQWMYLGNIALRMMTTQMRMMKPKKAEEGKKRQAESATKTHVLERKS